MASDIDAHARHSQWSDPGPHRAVLQRLMHRLMGAVADFGRRRAVPAAWLGRRDALAAEPATFTAASPVLGRHPWAAPGNTVLSF